MHPKLIEILNVFVVVLHLSSALNWETAREETCIPPQSDPSFDPALAGSVPTWYTVFGSRGKIYRMAEAFLDEKEFQDLTEQDLLSKFCMSFSFKGQQVPVRAFGNRVFNFDVFPNTLRPGVLDWTINDSQGKKKYVGTSYVAFTDNKSYVASHTIYTDGMMGFSVAATEKKLPKDTLFEIKEKIRGFGFNPKNFVTLNHDNCQVNKSEL